MLALPSSEASLCRREAGEKEKMKRAGDHGNGKGRKRDSCLFPLHIVPPPPPRLFFDYCYCIGMPSGSLCRGERETDQMVVSRHRKIDVKLLNKATEDAQDDHAVVFNTSKVTKLICSIVF